MPSCPVCGKSFDSSEEISGHIDASHEAMSSTYGEAFKATEEFKEQEHPRKESGQFTTKGSGTTSSKPEEKRFTLASYRRNENRNNHTSNALNLVKQYGTPEELKEMEEIAKRNKEGFSGEDGYKDYQRRYEISNKYYEQLVKEDEERKSKSKEGYDDKGNYTEKCPECGKVFDNPADAGSHSHGEEGADDALRKVADLTESWHRLNKEERAKIFESLGINQGNAYTLANLDWYNLSPQLKKDASEAYVKAEEEIVKCDVCNGKHKTEDHESVEINEAYADIYNIEKHHLSPDFKKKALECSRCNEKFYNNVDKDIHFNEFHATEQEYSLDDECPFCKEKIKEPETLDWHMEQEHGIHIPSQYTQTGIQGAMADTDFDRLEQSWGEAHKSGYIKCPKCDQEFSNLQYLQSHMKDTHGGNESYAKEEDIPSFESYTTEAKWECLDCDSEFDDARKHQEETGHHNIAKKSSEGTSDYEVDVDELLKTGEPVQKLPTNKRANEKNPTPREYWEEEGWKEAEWEWGLEDYSRNWDELSQEQRNTITKKFNNMVDEEPTLFESTANEARWQCDNCGKQFEDAKGATQHEKETGHHDMGFSTVLSGDSKWDKLSGEAYSTERTWRTDEEEKEEEFSHQRYSDLINKEGQPPASVPEKYYDKRGSRNKEDWILTLRSFLKWEYEQGKISWNTSVMFGESHANESRRSELEKKIKDKAKFINLASFENPLNMAEQNMELERLREELASLIESGMEAVPDEAFYKTYDTEEEVRALGATHPVRDENTGEWYWNNYIWRHQHGDDEAIKDMYQHGREASETNPTMIRKLIDDYQKQFGDDQPQDAKGTLQHLLKNGVSREDAVNELKNQGSYIDEALAIETIHYADVWWASLSKDDRAWYADKIGVKDEVNWESLTVREQDAISGYFGEKIFSEEKETNQARESYVCQNCGSEFDDYEDYKEHEEEHGGS